MSYRLDPSLYPSPTDSWFKKATLLVGAVVLAVEETAQWAPSNGAKRDQAIELFMKYVSAFGLDIPYVPSFLEEKILRTVAGMMIDRLAGLVKRARQRN